jgi:hypothetical protein
MVSSLVALTLASNVHHERFYGSGSRVGLFVSDPMNLLLRIVYGGRGRADYGGHGLRLNHTLKSLQYIGAIRQCNLVP